jgi:hypothetical protein
MMECELEETMRLHEDYRERATATIAFGNLWHLFAPEDIIYDPQEDQAFQILSVHGGRDIPNPAIYREGRYQKGTEKVDLLASMSETIQTPFVIDAFRIDFNGEVFVESLHPNLKTISSRGSVSGEHNDW